MCEGLTMTLMALSSPNISPPDSVTNSPKLSDISTSEEVDEQPLRTTLWDLPKR